MENKEFLKAIDAYLRGQASSWQIFILEDYFDSFKYNINILDLYRDEEVEIISKRIYNKIIESIDLLGKGGHQEDNDDE